MPLNPARQEAAIPPSTKIATCCYCGTRAALVLRGEGRHELSCSACGAPLHEMKALRSQRPAPARPRHYPEPVRHPGRKRRKPARKKKRRGLMSRFLEEAVDLIEDILD